MPENCENCFFYRSTTKPECHRLSPVHDGWPNTRTNEWCGKWSDSSFDFNKELLNYKTIIDRELKKFADREEKFAKDMESIPEPIKPNFNYGAPALYDERKLVEIVQNKWINLEKEKDHDFDADEMTAIRLILDELSEEIMRGSPYPQNPNKI